MKLIIDIQPKVYEAVKSGFYTTKERYATIDAVVNGTPLPPDLYKKTQTETDYTVSDRTRQIER